MQTRDQLLQDIENLRSENERWSKAFSQCMEYQNKGMACEKNKDYTGAIEAYSECISYNETVEEIIGSLRCLFSIERLAVIFRKLKQYDNEQNIISYALKHELPNAKRIMFEDRYRKSKSLQQKQ